MTTKPMTTTPIVLFYAAAAALGGYILRLWFRQARNPAFVALQLLLGAGALETPFAFIRLSNLLDTSPAHRLGMIAGSLMALAMFSGFDATVLGKQYRYAANLLLVTYICSGIGGFVIVLAVVAQV